MSQKNNPCAVVLGGYVNGYSIIQELHEEGVSPIILIDYLGELARHSKKITNYYKINKTAESLLSTLNEIHKKYGYLVLFPTDDLQLELLLAVEPTIKSFCFIPFNEENLSAAADKFTQYLACEKLGVPYPKTLNLSSENDIKELTNLAFPLILKPNIRRDLTQQVFRSLRLNSVAELWAKQKVLVDLLQSGVSLIASEIIPGNTHGSIYAYTAYRSRKGKILNEWIGKKLTQYPNDYGVFSSASNEAPEIVREQGQKLLHGMNLFGICEPEFKYDYRDQQYKLMEINLRSMMWHRLGSLSGVKLQYTQWLDAIGKETPTYSQNLTQKIHFSYLKHEIGNLLFRKGYYKQFSANLLGPNKKVVLATYDNSDKMPFIRDSFSIFKEIARIGLKKILRKNA